MAVIYPIKYYHAQARLPQGSSHFPGHFTNAFYPKYHLALVPKLFKNHHGVFYSYVLSLYHICLRQDLPKAASSGQGVG